MISRDPIYKQLIAIIREDIGKGVYQIGDRFLSERELSEVYGISRATANKAIACLAAEGVLESRKGAGTFVCASVIDYDLRSLVSFTEQAVAAGKRPSTRVLLLRKTKSIDLPIEVRKSLAINGEESVFYIERLRLADEVPMILEKRFVLCAF
ncbi:MAG: GntR family transcriptional regulator, partial [Phycisphaerales bacterium]|nr:GntR family transcriptional regulator [Phycisphaerales bacterium]